MDGDSRREGVQQIGEPSLGDDAADICRLLRGKTRVTRALNLLDAWGAFAEDGGNVGQGKSMTEGWVWCVCELLQGD